MKIQLLPKSKGKEVSPQPSPNGSLKAICIAATKFKADLLNPFVTPTIRFLARL